MFFELEEDEYNKPVRVGKFRSNIYIEYKSKCNRKTLSVEEYLNKIKPYLKDIIDDLKISDRQKLQLATSINFISSKKYDDKEWEIRSKSDNRNHD